LVVADIAFVTELQLVKSAYTAELSSILYIYDDYMVNAQLRADDAWIISPFTYNVIAYAIPFISGIISVLTNPLHAL
jgi:hypothetical protein